MSQVRARSSVRVTLAVVAGCTGAPDASTDRPTARSDAIVYGDDNRTEVYAHPDGRFRALARYSSVALIESWRISQGPDGSVRIAAPPLGDKLRLCRDQRFVEQPSAALCSGVLIDHNLVLTAGHCFGAHDGCDRYKYVFDFLYAQDGSLEDLTRDDIFECARIVVRRVSAHASAALHDYAVVQLDRTAAPSRTAVPLRSESLAASEQVVVIGHPDGVPAKIDDGGRVVETRSAVRDYFGATTDTFAGSSGSGVFDTDGMLLGVLVRGQTDYHPSDAGQCLVVNVAGNDPTHHEHATYAARAVAALCERAPGLSERLCGALACGDGSCLTWKSWGAIDWHRDRPGPPAARCQSGARAFCMGEGPVPESATVAGHMPRGEVAASAAWEAGTQGAANGQSGGCEVKPQRGTTGTPVWWLVLLAALNRRGRPRAAARPRPAQRALAML